MEAIVGEVYGMSSRGMRIWPTDPHLWLNGDLRSYTRIMRGEDELPHRSDGSCVECRLLFEEQLKLVSKSVVLPELMMDAQDYVRYGLAKLRENGNVGL